MRTRARGRALINAPLMSARRARCRCPPRYAAGAGCNTVLQYCASVNVNVASLFKGERERGRNPRQPERPPRHPRAGRRAPRPGGGAREGLEGPSTGGRVRVEKNFKKKKCRREI